MSLTDEKNRETFKAGERAYMQRFGLSDREMDLVGKRDWNGLVAAGGSIYLLIKIGGTIVNYAYMEGPAGAKVELVQR